MLNLTPDANWKIADPSTAAVASIVSAPVQPDTAAALVDTTQALQQFWTKPANFTPIVAPAAAGAVDVDVFNVPELADVPAPIRFLTITGGEIGSQSHWKYGSGLGSESQWKYGSGAGSESQWKYGSGAGSESQWKYGSGPGSESQWKYGSGPGSESQWKYGSGPGSESQWNYGSGPGSKSNWEYGS